MPTDYDEGYKAGYKAGYKVGYDAGYGDGTDAGHEGGYKAGLDDAKRAAVRVAEKGRFTVSMSSGLYTASLTEQPGISEDSVVSAYDALGKLVARLEAVRTMGRLVL